MISNEISSIKSISPSMHTYKTQSPLIKHKSKKMVNYSTFNNENQVEIKLIKQKLLIQQKILELYDAWVSILLLIVNDKPLNNNNYHYDNGTPIQKNLLVIEQYCQNNLKIKSKIVQEREKNDNLMNQLIDLRETFKCLQTDKEKLTLKQIKIEKEQLMKNIQSVANELDKQSETHKKIKEQLNTSDSNYYMNMINEYLRLKEENELLAKICNLDIQRKKIQWFKYDYLNENEDINFNVNMHSSSNNQKKFESIIENQNMYLNMSPNKKGNDYNHNTIAHNVQNSNNNNSNSNNNSDIAINKDDTFAFAFGLLSCV